jgi:predicted lactoylglutathione lyase
VEPRISLVTLGVEDLDRAARFYEAMGLERNAALTDGVAFFQMGGSILALWPREALARDAGVEATPPGFSGVALAYNARSEAEVDAVLAAAEAAGGKVTRAAKRADWGGYSGYFADSEGHLWEAAHNPGFPIDADGRVALPR